MGFGNPKAAHGLFTPGNFIDETENQFPLAPCVAGVDDFGNVLPVHKVFEGVKLRFLVSGDGVFPFLRQNG